MKNIRHHPKDASLRIPSQRYRPKDPAPNSPASVRQYPDSSRPYLAEWHLSLKAQEEQAQPQEFLPAFLSPAIFLIIPATIRISTAEIIIVPAFSAMKEIIGRPLSFYFDHFRVSFS